MVRIAATTTSTVLLPANRGRAFGTVYNEPGSGTLYLSLGGTSSTNDYTVQIAAGDYYEVPLVAYGVGLRPYPGNVSGVWDSATGGAQAREG